MFFLFCLKKLNNNDNNNNNNNNNPAVIRYLKNCTQMCERVIDSKIPFKSREVVEDFTLSIADLMGGRVWHCQ